MDALQQDPNNTEVPSPQTSDVGTVALVFAVIGDLLVLATFAVAYLRQDSDGWIMIVLGGMPSLLALVIGIALALVALGQPHRRRAQAVLALTLAALPLFILCPALSAVGEGI